jgi:hypothetical protein
MTAATVLREHPDAQLTRLTDEQLRAIKGVALVQIAQMGLRTKKQIEKLARAHVDDALDVLFEVAPVLRFRFDDKTLIVTPGGMIQ